MIDNDVNPTEISTNLAALSTWLNSIPNPSGIKASVQAALTKVGTLGTGMGSLETALTSLVGQLQPGAYSAALGQVVGGAPSYPDTTAAFLPGVSGQGTVS